MQIRVLRRRWFLLLLSLAAAASTVIVPRWKAASDSGGQKPVEPFRIAGNLYYVGANDVTSYLLTGPAGHVLIDGGYPGTAPMIIRSIEKLGFKIRDVKLLLNSHAHPDHAGGLAALKEASGAQLWVSQRDADVVETGGDDPMLGALRPLAWAGLVSFPPVHVDHRFSDGAHIRLGSTELIAHVTPGHTRGCTSWSFAVQDGARILKVVEICSLTLPPNLTLVRSEAYPGFRADYERTLHTLRDLHPDIFITPHAKDFGRWRKLQARAHSRDPVAPFIDPVGYADYINEAERRYRDEFHDRQESRSRLSHTAAAESPAAKREDEPRSNWRG